MSERTIWRGIPRLAPSPARAADASRPFRLTFDEETGVLSVECRVEIEGKPTWSPWLCEETVDARRVTHEIALRLEEVSAALLEHLVSSREHAWLEAAVAEARGPAEMAEAEAALIAAASRLELAERGATAFLVREGLQVPKDSPPAKKKEGEHG